MAASFAPLAAGGVPSDIAALVTTLGGNAAVNAIYDCRTGVTVVPGNQVSSWADARGSSGFGPSLVQGTSAKQPTQGSDNSILTVSATNQNLLAAANTLFDISAAYTLIFVGALPTPQTGTAYGTAIGNASTAFLGITQLGGSNAWGAKGGATIVQAETSPPIGTSSNVVRVVAATLGGATPLGIQVPNQAQVTTAIVGANAAGAAVLCVGGFNGASGNSNAIVRAVIAMPSLISGANLSAVLAWAASNHNAAGV